VCMRGREYVVNHKEKEGISYALAQTCFFLRGQKTIGVIASIVDVVPFRTALLFCVV
jgi:hypothetical protein